ncbi:MAG: hypothetical protein ACU0CC_18190 [Sagittula sp.]
MRIIGGISRDKLQSLKQISMQTAALRRAVSDLALDKLILNQVARGNC